jgi:hypothetical protein
MVLDLCAALHLSPAAWAAQPREEQARLLGWWRRRCKAATQTEALGHSPASSDARRVVSNVLRRLGRQVKATEAGLRFWGGGE